MGLFRYEAIDKAGKVVHGAMNARDEQQVAQRLAQMGYAARAIHGGAQTATRRQAAQPAAPAQPRSSGGIASVTVASGVPVSIKSSVPGPALARFFRHLATLVRSGMPINRALVEMSAVTGNQRLRSVLPRMQEATQGGRNLSGLMAEYPTVFPVYAIASVWAGELSGRLETALDEVATDLEQEVSETRFGRIGWFLTKISIISLVFAFPAANLVNLLIPVLQKTLDATHEISRSEVLRMLLDNYMRTMFWKSVWMSVAVVLAWIVWGYMKRVPTVRRLLDGALLCVPIWGKLHRYRALARFFHVLDELCSAGISPAPAWDAASMVPRNSAIAERLKLARANMSSGAMLSEMLAASGMIDHEDVALASSGEKAGQVPDVMAHLAASYQLRADAQRTAGRAAGVFVLTMFSIVFTGYVLIRVVSTYVELPFKAAEMIMGQ